METYNLKSDMVLTKDQINIMKTMDRKMMGMYEEKQELFNLIDKTYVELCNTKSLSEIVERLLNGIIESSFKGDGAAADAKVSVSDLVSIRNVMSQISANMERSTAEIDKIGAAMSE